ncbi:MAG: GHKL domain-containing protein [Bacteroidetes bacterium]|nr:GHKL domain-containing protein [Bacteroidota bacterium]
MNKQRLSILLMTITIAVIVAFQAFWLHKNFAEEKRLFVLHSNILFRETIFRLQASKLHLDTNIHIRIPDRAGLVSMTNVLQEEVRDTSLQHRHRKSSFILSLNHNGENFGKDTIKRIFFNDTLAIKQRIGPTIQEDDSNAMYNNPVYDFLIGVDSLQDSITVKEIEHNYKQILAKENVSTPFHIIAFNSELKEIRQPDPTDNKVMVGFSKPRTYQLEFDNLPWYISKRLFPQIIFSILLVGITIVSFLLLFRNWQRQKKLTQLKNDFIGNITHELKTPLATVSVAIEALRNFNALQNPDRTREYLDISQNELQRLSLLVDKVLKLSMFEKNEIELNNEYFDIRLLIEEVISSMRLQFEKYQASINMEYVGVDFGIRADKLHLTSVIFNLLDNALKYSKANPSIQIRLEEAQQQLRITVIDNGIGIPEAYKDKIFDKFFRVPTGDKHNVKGYGLGLSYIAYVLKRQGASIEVESKEGIGSSFMILIPKGNE